MANQSTSCNNNKFNVVIFQLSKITVIFKLFLKPFNLCILVK